MVRREFLKNSAIVLTAAAVMPSTLKAAESEFSPLAPQVGSDWSIVSDKVKDGVRYISATPSAKVCSKQIDIEITVKDKKIKKCSFTRGCPGNAIGLCNMLEGQTVSSVITKLKSVPCGNRGTSCPDQLARILESLKW